MKELGDNMTITKPKKKMSNKERTEILLEEASLIAEKIHLDRFTDSTCADDAQPIVRLTEILDLLIDLNNRRQFYPSSM